MTSNGSASEHNEIKIMGPPTPSILIEARGSHKYTHDTAQQLWRGLLHVYCSWHSKLSPCKLNGLLLVKRARALKDETSAILVGIS